MQEAGSRPAAIKEVQDAIDSLKSVIPLMKDNIESAALAASKSASSAASAASEAAASPSASASASADPLAELDDDAAPASSTTEAPIMPTDLPAIYSDEDVKALESAIAAATSWLAEKEAAQAKLGESDDAAVSVEELKDRAKKLNDVVTETMMKKMNAMKAHFQSQNQKPKAKPKAKPKTTKNKGKGKKNGKKAADAEKEKVKDRDAKTAPSEEELREAMEKAGLKGQGLKLENLGQLRDLKDKDGKPLLKLGLAEDASEEEILAAIDAVLAEGRKEKGEAHDEL